MDNLQALEVMKVVLVNFRQLRKDDREHILKKLQSEHDKLGDRVDDPLADVKQRYIDGGRRNTHTNNFLQAIREVRAVAGLGLKEAKELVESW